MVIIDIYYGNILSLLKKSLTYLDTILAKSSAIKVLNIRYSDRIGWGFFISDIRYRGRYRGYTCVSGVHIGHYI